MHGRQIKRITRELTDLENSRLQEYREQIGRELPDLQVRNQMREDARSEATLSGELRRAIHESELSLAALAAQAGLTPIWLDDFLTGERTLRSDVLDRLAKALGYELQRSE
jgi:transcriptional regulator with XRE-family HTH domain